MVRERDGVRVRVKGRDVAKVRDRVGILISFPLGICTPCF
jgi:hypothetical protein